MTINSGQIIDGVQGCFQVTSTWSADLSGDVQVFGHITDEERSVEEHVFIVPIDVDVKDLQLQNSREEPKLIHKDSHLIYACHKCTLGEDH